MDDHHDNIIIIITWSNVDSRNAYGPGGGRRIIRSRPGYVIKFKNGVARVIIPTGRTHGPER